MSLQLEMISCGDCKKCLAGGRVHGPYWYRYFRRNGKMVSEYVGKEIPSEDATKKYPEGSTPEDVEPERVERMQTEAERDAEARKAALTPAQRTVIGSIVQMQAAAQRAYRRSRKTDGAQKADALEEQQQLRDRIGKEKAALRGRLAEETEEAVGA